MTDLPTSPDETAQSSIQQSMLHVIDGQRVVWAQTPGPRTFAELLFRVGVADETVPTRGITHLLEHLVLADADLRNDHNGSTATYFTGLTVSGTLAEVDAHVARSVANLSTIPASRLEMEKQILRAEADGRGAGILDRVALQRYGATGLGLANYPEWGLDRIDAGLLAHWSSTYFTAENSVLVIAGPELPERLGWRLPTGVARPVPELQVHVANQPGFAYDRIPGPALIAEIERGSAALLFAAVADLQLRAVLRGARGLSYTAGAGYFPIGGGRAAVLAHADSVEDQAQSTVDSFLEVLYRIAAEGPAAEALTDLVATQEANRTDQAYLAGRARSYAQDLLFGEAQTNTDEELFARMRAVTPAEVAAVAEHVLRTATVVLPHGARELGRGGFTPVLSVDTDPVTGQSFDQPVEEGDVPVQVIVGAEGASLVRGERTVSVRFRDLAALGRSAGGRRLLISRTGDVVTLDPAVVDPATLGWVDGAAGANLWVGELGMVESPPYVPATTPDPGTALADALPPLTKRQKLLVRPLRAICIAVVTFFVLAMVWPAEADGTFVGVGDVVVFLAPLAIALVESYWWEVRTRRRNAAQAALEYAAKGGRR